MSRLAGWIASSVALLLACSPGLTVQSPVSAADAAGPIMGWARHAWQPSEGMPDGPITAIVPLVDGSLLVAGKTGRCRLAGDRVWPLAVTDPQCAKLDHVPLDPWLAAGRAATSPCTSQCRTADGTVFSGFLHGPPARSSAQPPASGQGQDVGAQDWAHDPDRENQAPIRPRIWRCS